MGVLHLPHAIPAIGGSYYKGDLLERTSRISLFGRCKLLKVNEDHFLPVGLIKLGTKKGRCMGLKTSMDYKVLCIRRGEACGHCFNQARKSDWSHVGSPGYPQRRTLRHIVPKSDVVRTGTAEADYSPLSVGLHFGPKVRGACFYVVTAIVAIFLFVLMLVAHPFVLLFDRYRRKAHHLIAKMWAALTIAPFFNVEVEGLEHLPRPDMPAVYVSNHQSFLDIYTLLTLGRCFKFISKTSIFVFPVVGWSMLLMGVIPLKRMDSRSQMECLKRCMDLIRGGASVFFFPEGTRSRDGKLGAFKKGAFSVAAKTGVPVVPMTIMGTGNIMPAGKEGLLNPGSVKVVVHPILVGSDAQELCNRARRVIADTLGEQG
uniref:1-acyl-sn-glycerol-3-phosphate acyltransferase n=1 Tax=Opuntia streptacantha TaxID=393608 RepID=A0A7C9F0B2_OPUST